MTRWQRRARLIIAVFAVVFAAVVARQLKPRSKPPTSSSIPRTDPGAAVESTGGQSERFTGARPEFKVTFDKQLTYPDGSTKLQGVTVVTNERGGDRTFTLKGKEGKAGQNESALTLDGDVVLVGSDGMTVRTQQATYDDREGVVRMPGPVEFSRNRMSGTGLGSNYDKKRDALTLLQQAVVHMAPDEHGADATDVTAGSAEFARREKFVHFDGVVTIKRTGQTIESDAAVALLTDDDKHIDSMQLHGNARITTPGAAAGALQGLSGREMNLKYGPGGAALQQAIVTGDGVIKVAGETGKPGRQINANAFDIALAPDGSTPTALIAREAVQLLMPAEAGAAERTIRSSMLDAKGEPGRGLTKALFSGSVQFHEAGPDVSRDARSTTLDVDLKPGMSGIDEARFSHAVRFVEKDMTATAAAARYNLDKGTLELSGAEPGAMVPRVVNEQIAVDAAKIDVTLEGPKVKATGTATDKVKSVLQGSKPAGQTAAGGASPKNDAMKMPSMLKQDQPVNVTAVSLDYDGPASMTVYEGSAQLWQGDTSIKGATITIDGKAGDLGATAVTSLTTLDQTNKETNKKERVRSGATAKDLKYEDVLRRLTYTGDAHLSGPEGDMTAAKIELYLKPSGDELDRAEAYDDVTLREQSRKTTGNRMTYTTADDRYVVVGAPVKIVDQCERETTGKTLTFVKGADSIVVDGNQQTRTLTKGGGKCTS
jgi:LPS export ABC transporter protein LptC/lipopolysaccharide transport protein LptA